MYTVGEERTHFGYNAITGEDDNKLTKTEMFLAVAIKVALFVGLISLIF